MAITPMLIDEAAHRFALLGDPTRLRILHAIIDAGELTVGAIASAVGTSRFNASAHLNRLFDAGLVTRRRAGTAVYYRTADDQLPRVCEWMCASLRARARELVDAEAPA